MSGERLLIVRLGSMGDIIHTLPAVATLRLAFPNASIGWAVEPRWHALLSTDAAIDAPRSPQKPLVDTVHALDTLGWRAAPFSGETWRQVRSAVREMRDVRYDVAVDFQGAWKTAIVSQLSRAPRRLGFMQPRETPATLFYSHQLAARGRHIVEQNLSLAQAIAPDQPPQFCFPLPHDLEAERAVEQRLREDGLHRFALVNPGAGWGAKCWPAERYAEVVRSLAVHGLRSIVNFGPGEEDLAGAVQAAAGTAAIPLSSSVAELIALTRRARLFVGGDTGPMHLAAALNVPVVALFGPTDPARTGPYCQRAVILRSPASSTTTSHRPEPEAGLLQIAAEEAIAAARYLLAQPATAEIRP